MICFLLLAYPFQDENKTTAGGKKSTYSARTRFSTEIGKISILANLQTALQKTRSTNFIKGAKY